MTSELISNVVIALMLTAFAIAAFLWSVAMTLAAGRVRRKNKRLDEDYQLARINAARDGLPPPPPPNRICLTP